LCDRHLFTSESVTEGHPDRIADAISDAVLDAILADDPTARVACETLVTTGLACVAGEITTSTYVHVPDIVRATIELRRRGHKVAREVSVPVFYDGIQIAKYRLDFLVDDLIVLEVKSTALLNPSDQRQLLNCLCATKFEVGLLLHFGPKPKFYRLRSSAEVCVKGGFWV